MKLDDPVSLEELRKIVRGHIGVRATFLCFVWKVLQEKGLDATALVQEACWRFGVANGKKLGEIKTPADYLKRISSKAGTLMFEQEYTVLNDEQASKEFNYCPHVEALKAVGASKDEIATICKDYVMCRRLYVKVIDPKNVTIGDIYRSVTPFLLLQLTGLIIVFIFPKIALWLPNLMFSK